MDQIDKIRKEIDVLDTEIMELLNKRYRLTTEIGRLKKETNTNVLDSNREDIIYDKTSKYSHYPQLRAIYKTIMEESKKLQRK